MKKLFLIFLSLFFSIFTMASTSAITLITEENLILKEPIIDNAYILAGQGKIENEVFKDLWIAGGQLFIEGKIHEDLVVVAGIVNVNADVDGDIRVLGGQVIISENVGGDIVVIGGQIDISENSVIEGTLLMGAGLANVNGTIKKDIRGFIGMLILNGIVENNVDVTIQDSLYISELASIEGDLKYSALLETKIPENVVKGEIEFNKFDKENILGRFTPAMLIKKAISFLAAFVLLILTVTFYPKLLIRSGNLTRKQILKSLGVGILTILISIFAILFLMISIIGIPLGLIVLSFFIVSILLSKIFVAAWLASYLVNYKRKLRKIKLLGGTFLALLVYYLLGMIPVVGFIFTFVLFLVGLGSIVLTKKDYIKFLKSKNYL